MKRLKGFTLPELLIVIAIIGLLSAIGFFSLNLVKARARDAIRAADMDQLVKALDLYNNTTGAYPIMYPDPVCLDGEDAITSALEGAGLITAEYTDPIFPEDPDRCYKYVSDSTGTTYAIQYYLETDSVKSQGFHTAPF